MKKLIFYNYIFIELCDHLNHPITEEIQLLHKIGIANCFIDRTNTLPLGYNYSNLYPIPTFDPMFDKSLEDIIDDRAQEIINLAMSQMKGIDLYWSGGIDSTVALFALLKNSDKNNRHLINVFYTENSLSEYPGCFEQWIENSGMNHIKLNDISEGIKLNNIAVTGELGDQLFGSNLLVDIYNPDNIEEDISYIHLPWESKLRERISSIEFISEDSIERLVSLMKELNNKAPFPIITFFDFLWWCNFTLKWQETAIRVIKDRDITQEELNNVQHFFDSEDFQQWAMQPINHESKILSTWSSYKEPLKEYIFDYNGDREYYTNKTKIGSMQLDHTFFIPHKTVMLLDDLTRITYGTNSRNHRLFDIKYGRDFLDDLFNQ